VVSGLHVPWAVGGPRINAAGKLEDFPGEWPTVPVHALRLWDTRTAWLHLQPTPDQWTFAHLDDHLAKAAANGVVDITLVLWGTPRWAASGESPQDAPWLGPGSAWPPSDLADWDAYVSTVVDRYAGRIGAYEIGNEPNLRAFWQGTPTALAEMTARAARIIRARDPKARILAPAVSLADSRGLSSASRFWRALAKAGADLDVATFNWYPRVADPRQIAPLSRAVREGMIRAGMPRLPMWVTEAGFRRAGATRISTLIPRTLTAAQGTGVRRMYWYAWTDLPLGPLLPLHTGTRLAMGLT